MNILVAGVDGYLGWALAQHLASKGHRIVGVDNGSRRGWVREVGSHSATPILESGERAIAFTSRFGSDHSFHVGDLRDYRVCRDLLSAFRPDAVVHLAEMPSAPYSMIDVDHAVFTQINNVTGTLNLLHAIREVCPRTHLVKLGTMGEYGVPNVDIPEGFFEIEYRGRKDTLPFPRQAGSWYHQSKVHDSNNIAMACRIWGLRSTDIMQGVVYGTRVAPDHDDRFLTRFDFDQCFGTVINRFCAQAVIGEPLTVYGKGGQVRSFLPLKDSIQCLTLAIEHPPTAGEYRVFNQFEGVYSIADLAVRVRAAAAEADLSVDIVTLENPRSEVEHHHYNPDHRKLSDLGYIPTKDMHSELRAILMDLQPHRGRILEKKSALHPDIRWAGEKRPCPLT